MEILKNGDPEKAHRKEQFIRYFTCHDCGCEWSGTIKEYYLGPKGSPGPYMDCPCCGKMFVSACSNAHESLL